MYQIVFYSAPSGESPVIKFLEKLRSLPGKDSRIQYDQAVHHIRLLQTYRTHIGFPFVKHLTDGIWELRPVCNRILFFQEGEVFILLHAFRKKSRKTPRGEVERAKAERADWLNR